MDDQDWHDEQTPRAVLPRLGAGSLVQGIVACSHDFGVGVYIPDRDEFAHVAPDRVRDSGANDPPPVDTNISAIVLGYDELGRMLVSTRLRDLAAYQG